MDTVTDNTPNKKLKVIYLRIGDSKPEPEIVDSVTFDNFAGHNWIGWIREGKSEPTYVRVDEVSMIVPV
jgi:hypothetical protein